jgi:hypothetical protein
MPHFLWTQKQDIGPTPRTNTAMVFDAARGRTMLFGGTGLAFMADTWEWDGNEWTQKADIGPAARNSHALAYDSNRQRIVLYGGYSPSISGNMADTWEWDGSE